MDQRADFPFCIEDVVHLVGLRIRRQCGDGVYTDCPFCGDNRGKLKVNYIANVWRCNYCQESGGILHLYAKIHNTSLSSAYREICDAIMNGIVVSSKPLSRESSANTRPVTESTRASADVIHATYTAMLDQLLLKKEHREHLHTVRGLSDAEIDRLGFRSTPPFYMCRSITERLIGLGHTVQGVPGFYQKDGKWTLNFCSYTAGILLPAKDHEGRISGFQIRLDTPLKSSDATSDKPGAKYIWLSSSGKQNGCSSGSPVHLIGERNAKTVYVTELTLDEYFLYSLAYITDHPKRQWSSHVNHDKAAANWGYAMVRGIDPVARGKIGDYLAFAKESVDRSCIEQITLVRVDGETILPDVWYDVNLNERNEII